MDSVLYQETRYQRNDEVLEYVREIVDVIAHEIGETESKLRTEEVIFFGSAAENTQVGKTSDFDFQLVLDDLSKPDAVDTLDVSDDNCYVHITVNGDIKRTWAELLDYGQLRSSKDRRRSSENGGIRQLFHKVLQVVVSHLPDFKTSTGVLKNNQKIKKHGPAFSVYFTWVQDFTGVQDFTWVQDHVKDVERAVQEERTEHVKYTEKEARVFLSERTVKERENSLRERRIKIDLCPVIRFRQTTRHINQETVGCQSYYDYLQKVGSVMLMPFERRAACDSGKCFKITFAEIEVLLMKDMSGHHRKCFIMLKQMFGFDGRQANAIINSYALKTLVLNHHYKEGCKEMSNIEQCMEKIFEDIRTILRGAKQTKFGLQMFLPSLFLTTHNVWNQDQDIRNKDLEKRIDNLTKRLQCLKHDSRVYYSKNVHCSSYTFFKENGFCKTFRITTATLLCIVAASSFGFIIGYNWKESLNTCSNELCHSII